MILKIVYLGVIVGSIVYVLSLFRRTSNGAAKKEINDLTRAINSEEADVKRAQTKADTTLEDYEKFKKEHFGPNSFDDDDDDHKPAS